MKQLEYMGGKSQGVTVLLSESLERNKKIGLRPSNLNSRKTKIKDLDRSKTSAISIDGEQSEYVKHFVYLGARIYAYGKTTPKIKRKLAIASTKLTPMKQLWTGQDLNLRINILLTCIFPSAMCGCQIWSVTKTNDNKFNDLEKK